MKINLTDLQAFVGVAELGSFRAAAESVHLSQPALSRRVEKLEEALGVRLFDRTTRRVSMTAVGRDFSRKARALLDELEGALLAIRDVAATQSGEVTVACVPSAVYYYLPDFIRRYHEKNPRIRVRIIDEAANTVLASVICGEADFGVNFIGTQEPELDFQPLMQERFVAACRRDHPLARKKRVSWTELGAYDYMTVSKSSGNRLLLDLALAEVAGRPKWFYEVRHVETLLGLVEAGLGVAAVTQLALPGSADSVLVGVPLVEPVVTRTLGLISRRGRSLPPAAQAFYDLLMADMPAKPRKTAQARNASRLS